MLKFKNTKTGNVVSYFYGRSGRLMWKAEFPDGRVEVDYLADNAEKTLADVREQLKEAEADGTIIYIENTGD